jgi:hypothetical protein
VTGRNTPSVAGDRAGGGLHDVTGKVHRYPSVQQVLPALARIRGPLFQISPMIAYLLLLAGIPRTYKSLRHIEERARIVRRQNLMRRDQLLAHHQQIADFIR